MKIIIFKNFDLIYPEIRTIFNDTTFPESRIADFTDCTNFAYWLEKRAQVGPENIIEKANWRIAHRHDGTIEKSIIDNIVYYRPTYGDWFVKIVEVDESRPWRIMTSVDYDADDQPIGTLEYVEYLDYFIKNKRMNYAEKGVAKNDN